MKNLILIFGLLLSISLSATKDIINNSNYQCKEITDNLICDEECCTGCGVYGINCICGVTLIFQWCESCCFQPGYGDLHSYGIGLCAGRCGGGIE
ncbi:MAG TPA: hypothetical protein PKD85_10855 [Saprospiraceae bacterium]|nr:hypothetical protein [Saprospiraceae bacterium]